MFRFNRLKEEETYLRDTAVRRTTARRSDRNIISLHEQKRRAIKCIALYHWAMCSFFIHVLSNQATVPRRKQSSEVKLGVSWSELTRKAISIARGWVSVNFAVRHPGPHPKVLPYSSSSPSGLLPAGSKRRALDGNCNFIHAHKKLSLLSLPCKPSDIVKIYISRELFAGG